jgi:hypothetical protein
MEFKPQGEEIGHPLYELEKDEKKGGCGKFLFSKNMYLQQIQID